MQRINYFIEGLQGAGKSTFVRRLSEYLKDYQVFREETIPLWNWRGALM